MEYLRYNLRTQKTITTSLATTGQFCMLDYVGGFLSIPAGWLSTTLDVYFADDNDGVPGTYGRFRNAQGALVSIPTPNAGERVELPSSMFPGAWVKFVSDADDSSRPLTISLKS